ncbi:transmembrane protein 53-like [Acanthaster planci]|uniref:Transmembrane protein 53-like n=1 Tax=Acanthaster planci TaxID=133434 RepID=A0A8B7Y294_ACAPL|nr:transmembrane protein 53-like [Acanthaster planci]
MADTQVEDLEYHVTFPTAISADSGDGNSDNPAQSDRKEPVVILLGWAGCEDRHLSKYSAIYHSIGFTTVRYTLPSQHMVSAPKIKVIARKVLELVFDLGLEENVVFFHVFSNAGCFIYRYITQYLHNPEFGGGELASIKVGGCIFDSAPCATSLLMYLKVRNRADKTSGFFMRIVHIVIILLAGILSFFLPSGSSWNIRQDISSFMSEMKIDRSRYPQLYLYSKTDDICDWRGVEDVVEARRKKGSEVQQVCWQESPHCAHLLAHRDEYIQNCQDFVQGCLLTFMDED